MKKLHRTKGELNYQSPIDNYDFIFEISTRKAFLINTLTIASIIAIVVILFCMAFLKHQMYKPLYVIIVASLCGSFINYRGGQNIYICPRCNQRFKISFLTSAFSHNGGAKGKMLECPRCKNRVRMKKYFKSNL